MSVTWDRIAEEKFAQMIERVPGPMQGIAQDMVNKKAVEFVEKDGRETITEKDLIDAFFEVTPFGFHGPMKTDMEAVGLDYKQHGYAT